MFFPCTSKEKVTIDESVLINGHLIGQDKPKATPNGESLEEPKYLTKATVIMCNPNALYYQQMVTSPNAYWLNFFLKRDINVLCWNYRGYG